MTQNPSDLQSSIKTNLQERFPDLKKRATAFSQKIEDRARSIPDSGLITAAGISMIASAVLALSGRRKGLASFVGLWAPSILLVGIYAKLLKMDRKSAALSLSR
ncbi:MAG: hypothetical protein RJB38_648 [Pseudomonadota bacterium]|jgi:hypothetical protein